MNTHYEIERKYLVALPEFPLPCEDDVSDIEQAYLISAPGMTDRVRKRGSKYYHTLKKPVSGVKAEETECEITREEYVRLLARRDPERALIKKTRHVFTYNGQVFELDVFDYWARQAMLEIELTDENVPVELPPFLRLIREVTDEPVYKNRMMAKEIPPEA